MRKLGLFQLLAPTTLIAIFSSSPVLGQVVETSSIQNTYRYNIAGQEGAGSNSGGSNSIFRRIANQNGISEMGLSLTGTLDNGSFFFLHNGQCVGVCYLTLTTDITFSLFNSGSSPVNLRFDSQITPGHLANSFLLPGGNSQANFDFSVSQDPGSGQGPLYRARGNAALSPPEVSTRDDSVFNGFTIDNNSPDWTVADWSATDIFVVLATLAPGETKNLYYSSTLTISTDRADCGDPTLCESFQVAFGDPRNAGGVINASPLGTFASFPDSSLLGSEPLIPAVGAPYDPFRVSYRFVDVAAPPSFTSPVNPRINYDINYASADIGAVPEPATWAFLVLGFGLIGGLMRHGRACRLPGISGAPSLLDRATLSTILGR